MAEKSKFSHRDLCEIGARFLKRPASQNGHGCHFVIVEASCYGENPDVFGVRHGYEYQAKEDGTFSGAFDVGSILIEVKTSRSDFLVDAKKKPRQYPETGVGKWRYYLCPTGLIREDELPAQWGLIYVNSRGHCEIVKGALSVKFKHSGGYRYRNLTESFAQYAFPKRNVQNEQNILTMALARLKDAESLLYMQRKLNNLEMRYMNLKHENRILERGRLNLSEKDKAELSDLSIQLKELSALAMEIEKNGD